MPRIFRFITPYLFIQQTYFSFVYSEPFRLGETGCGHSSSRVRGACEGPGEHFPKLLSQRKTVRVYNHSLEKEEWTANAC